MLIIIVFCAGTMADLIATATKEIKNMSNIACRNGSSPYYPESLTEKIRPEPLDALIARLLSDPIMIKLYINTIGANPNNEAHAQWDRSISEFLSNNSVFIDSFRLMAFLLTIDDRFYRRLDDFSNLLTENRKLEVTRYHSNLNNPCAPMQFKDHPR